MFDDEEELRALKEIKRKLKVAAATAGDKDSIDPELTREEYVRLLGLLTESELGDPKVRDELITILSKITSH